MLLGTGDAVLWEPGSSPYGINPEALAFMREELMAVKLDGNEPDSRERVAEANRRSTDENEIEKASRKLAAKVAEEPNLFGLNLYGIALTQVRATLRENIAGI